MTTGLCSLACSIYGLCSLACSLDGHKFGFCSLDCNKNSRTASYLPRDLGPLGLTAAASTTWTASGLASSDSFHSFSINNMHVSILRLASLAISVP